MLVADAVYAAADRDPAKPTASDWQAAKALRIVRRFLRELPPDLTVADLRAELEQPE